MRFIEKLAELQNINLRNTIVQINGTKLVGISPQGTCLAEHYIYAPMSAKVKALLLNSYKRNIPDQVLKIYETANGCCLFWTSVEIGIRKFKIPMAQLSVYGVPAENGSADALEPYNISVEDLDRPAETPDNWLKFGSYRDFSQTKPVEYDLFVDVDLGSVHTVIRKAEKCRIEQTWESMDDCLCDLFQTIQLRK